jgi:PadR family transcriptional regulator PadR
MTRAMSMSSLKVVGMFLASPSSELWGQHIADQTGLLAGTLYPILYRFEAAGWLVSRAEDVDASEVGRRPRRYYRMTGEGLHYFESIREAVGASLSVRPGRGSLPI